MILYEYTYEREGNDSWLKDMVQLHHNDMGLYLDHKKKYTGWGSDVKGSYTLELDEDDIEKSQKLLDDYIENNNLYCEHLNGDCEGIQIHLKEIMEINQSI